MSPAGPEQSIDSIQVNALLIAKSGSAALNRTTEQGHQPQSRSFQTQAGLDGVLAQDASLWLHEVGIARADSADMHATTHCGTWQHVLHHAIDPKYGAKMPSKGEEPREDESQSSPAHTAGPETTQSDGIIGVVG